MENIKKCGEELDIALTEQGFEKSTNYKCFFKCLMEKDGILVNETFSQERFKEVLADDKRLNDPDRFNILKVLPICFDEAKYINDLCNKSFTVIYCLHKIV